MNKRELSRGSVTLEISIVLPIFIFLFLFIYGLFGVISARNQITHALIQSTKSLSLDSYMTESIESIKEEAVNIWDGLEGLLFDDARADNNEYFTSRSDWYKSGGDSDIFRDRFVGFLTGGDSAAAEEKLKNLGIIGGLNGITFIPQISGEILTITIEYEIQYWFDFFGAGKIPMKQTITSRLWM